MQEAVGNGSKTIEATEPSEFAAGDEDTLRQAVIENVEARGDEDKPESDKLPSAPEYDVQETIDYLVNYYGLEQQFDYFGRKGNILQIVTMCPPIKFILTQGPDVVIDWIDAYKVEDVVEEAKVDDKGAEEEGQESDDSGKGVVEKPIIHEVKIDEADAGKTSEPIDRSEVSKKTAVIQANAVEEKSLTKDKSLAAPESVVTAAAPVEVAVERVRPVEKSADMAKDTPLEDKTALELTYPDVDVAFNETVEQIQDEAIESVELADFVESAAEIEDDLDESAEQLNETILESEQIETSALVAESFDAWHELAENDTPIDEFFVDVIERLQFADEQPHELDVELLSEDEIELVGDKLVLPELQAMLAEVQSVKKAIKHLYGATSKEECMTHVDEVVVTLARLLCAFGYDNPEKMIRDFLYAHPLSSLQELVDELELTLRRSIQYETLRLKQLAHHKRRSALSKLVQSVLQALAPKNPVFDTQA